MLKGMAKLLIIAGLAIGGLSVITLRNLPADSAEYMLSRFNIILGILMFVLGAAYLALNANKNK